MLISLYCFEIDDFIEGHVSSCKSCGDTVVVTFEFTYEIF